MKNVLNTTTHGTHATFNRGRESGCTDDVRGAE